ncbi:class I SAM-dependent methyltransferase [Methylobacterium oxalidis]|uniref:class I SAM-dependent methyltransferase n=1 Tax=Methylobacterium oxalidis TaxID=944322 RepID=UPI0033161B26
MTAEAGSPRNWFDRGGASYARFRPEYPPALAASLAGFAPSDALAVDVGCGSGQLTAQLAGVFRAVVGLDPSADQIASAPARAGIRYACAPAEALPLPDRGADLIAAAQAAHWFDLDAFYAEVRRVLVPGGALALVTYGVIEADGEAGRVLRHFYRDVIGPYWPPERRHVETGYRTLPFPFAEVSPPALAMTRDWSLADLLGYVGTWSAVRNAETSLGREPLDRFGRELGAAWGEPERRREIRWPLSMRIGHV